MTYIYINACEEYILAVQVPWNGLFRLMVDVAGLPLRSGLLRASLSTHSDSQYKV